MRHGKKFNHLGRKSAHRKAMLSNMACSLIEHKRITTTVAKAKELRKFVEPLVNRSKDDTTHSRRVCFSYLGSKHAVTELFREVGPKVSTREGGYTRIIRTGNRLGDNADMCMIELVDWTQVVACPIRPPGSWGHLMLLVLFVATRGAISVASILLRRVTRRPLAQVFVWSVATLATAMESFSTGTC